MHHRMRIGNFSLLLLLVSVINGCASIRTNDGTAIIYSTVFEIPIVYGNSVFVESIDGKQADRSKGYVEVEPGDRIIRVGYVSCVFPIFIFTCLSDFFGCRNRGNIGAKCRLPVI